MGGVCTRSYAIKVSEPQDIGCLSTIMRMESVSEKQLKFTGRRASRLAYAERYSASLVQESDNNYKVQPSGTTILICDSSNDGLKAIANSARVQVPDPTVKLFYLTAQGDQEQVKILIDNGVPVNATDYLGRTALHIAAERGHLELVHFLIKQGVDVNHKDKHSETALDKAIERKQVAVQNVIRAAGGTKPNESSESSPKRSRRASFTAMEAFPKPIAEAMMDGRKVEPISKESVSLFYSDIVGFTTISSSMDSATVSRMLNALFTKLDRLAYLHGVQKVDVVGDAYIAATNLTENQPGDHAARLARFAVDAIEAARDTPLDDRAPAERGHVEMRVGLHTGPVFAGLVGARATKYTLMGEAVHVAARMESSGAPGRVQCSAAAAAVIAQQANDLDLMRREGGVSLEGGKAVETYWVSSMRRPSGRFRTCPDLSHLFDALPGADADADATGKGCGHHAAAVATRGSARRRASCAAPVGPAEEQLPVSAVTLTVQHSPVCAVGRVGAGAADGRRKGRPELSRARSLIVRH